MSVDFERVALLMSIASQQPHFPDLPNIHAKALDELRKIDAALKPQPAPESKPVPVAAIGDETKGVRKL